MLSLFKLRSIDSILLIFIGAFLIFNFHYGRFESTDELFFKVAGKNLAQKGRFNAPELTGFLGDNTIPAAVEDVFFVQPPMYPFLFALFVKVFGFGWRQCVMYDALIHSLLVFVTMLLAKTTVGSLPVFKNEPLGRWIPLVPALMIMPLGTTGRPDELAMIFGMLGIIWFMEDLSIGRVIASAICFALSATTSVGAAIELGFVAISLILFSHHFLRTKLTLTFSWLTYYALFFFFLLLPLLLRYPMAYQQYLIHARQHVFSSFILGLEFVSKYHIQYILIIVSALLVAGLSLVTIHHILKLKKLAALWIGGIAGVIFALWTLPGKFTYLWMVVPLLAVAAFLSAVFIATHTRSRSLRIALLCIALLVSFCYARSLQQTLILITLDETQRPQFNESLLREVILPGSSVIAQSGWWFLGEGVIAYDSVFSNKSDLEDIDYIVLTATGSGIPGVPHWPPKPQYKELLMKDFEEVENNLLAEPNKIFNFPLSRSGNGFGVAIYTRKQLNTSWR